MKHVLRVAIVGTGPAGMYALEHLLEEQGMDVEIDLFERLPVPWGLVRYGVAPDHPEKKMVADNLFSYFLGRSNVNYFGNVEIGKDIPHTDLADWYDAVIYASGAGGDKQMGIPGEKLPGCWAAREFVAWYNGHPDYSHLGIDLSSERAVVVGNGNVALDVARILLLPPEELAKTDIADHALVALRDSHVKEVVILGRRGYLQSAFNNPELEELAELDDVEIIVDGDDLPDEHDAVSDDIDWETGRKVRTLGRLARRRFNADKKIIFRFLSSPIELIGDSKVEKILVVGNHLIRDESGRLQAMPSGEESVLETGLILRAIGYRGYPFPGLPFDEHKGVIANVDGRVVNSGQILPGVYVTGWIKRGPRGIIGTNKQCAKETVEALLADVNCNRLDRTNTLDREKVLELVSQRKSDIVSLDKWRKIDRFEKLQGRLWQRPRNKICDIYKMLYVACN